MAFTTDVEVCNLALHKIGHKSITSALLATPGNNKAAQSCKVLFDPERDAMMEMHPPWRFLLKKVVFDVDNFKDTITGGTQASPVVITGTDISIANVADDLGVHISGTGEDEADDLVFVIQNMNDTAQTIELYHLDRITKLDGSGWTAALTAGSLRIAPLYEFTYAYKLPTDFIRVWEIQGVSGLYKREGNYLHTDDDEVSLTYVFSDTTVTNWPSIFIMCLATKLASELAIAVAEKPEKKQELLRELEILHLPRAHILNATETAPKDDQEREDRLQEREVGAAKAQSD